MGDANKPEISIQIPSQPSEIVDNSPQGSRPAENSENAQEMPTVTTLLQRKKLSAVAKPAEPAAAPVAAVVPQIALVDTSIADGLAAAPQVTPARRRGTHTISMESIAAAERGSNAPPLFRGSLVLERLDLKSFHKSLKTHKKSADLRKLDCLGYFSTRFSEIMYFQVSDDASGVFKGILGFGNADLVTGARDKSISAQTLPSIFEILTQGEIFVGPIENLRAEDQKALRELGFSATQSIGAFPMMRKKSVAGMWLCATRVLEEIPIKELKALRKILADLVF